MDVKKYIINDIKIVCEIVIQDNYSNCKIIKSYEIISKEIQKLLLEKLLEDYPVFQARSIKSYIREWRAHNTLFCWGVEQARTRDTDLNVNEKKFRRFCYFFLSLIPQQQYTEPTTRKGEPQG